MPRFPFEFIIPGVFAIIIFPLAINFEYGIFGMLWSSLLNAGACIAGSLSFRFVKTPKFAFLWIVEMGFVLAFGISRFHVISEVRYWGFLVASVILALTLYVVFAIAKMSLFWPPGTIWLLVAALEVYLWKLPKKGAFDEAVSLGVALWASQCVAAFCWSVDFDKMKAKETLFAAGWLPLALFLCIIQ